MPIDHCYPPETLLKCLNVLKVPKGKFTRPLMVLSTIKNIKNLKVRHSTVLQQSLILTGFRHTIWYERFWSILCTFSTQNLVRSTILLRKVKTSRCIMLNLMVSHGYIWTWRFFLSVIKDTPTIVTDYVFFWYYSKRFFY